MGATCLTLLLASFLPGGSPEEGWTFDFHPLLCTGVDARWEEGEPVMDDWAVDFSTRLTARSEIFDASATGAFVADTTVLVTLRRASAGVRWPGSPWIATGIGLADDQPFEPGLPVPLVELGWMDIDSLLSFTAGAGGVLGFRGRISLMAEQGTGDTLAVTGIDAPWLGFGTASWSRYHMSGSGGESEFSVVSAMIDVRVAEPWVVVARGDDDGEWGVSARVRGWSPVGTRYGRIEVVPGMSFSGDSSFLPGSAFVPGERVLTLDLLHRSQDRCLSVSAGGRVDLEGLSDDGGRLGLDMISEAGVEYRLGTWFGEGGDWNARLDADYRRSAAGGGLSVAATRDSTRCFGRASYSPVRGVTAFVELSGDVYDGGEGTLDPAGLLRVTVSRARFIGGFSADWDGEQVLFRIETRGVFW